MPAMFWSLALLLLPEHAAAQQRVLQELQDTAHSIREQQQGMQPQQQGQSAAGCSSLDDATAAAMLQLALDKRSWVSRCVAEAIRLRLHSIAGEAGGGAGWLQQLGRVSMLPQGKVMGAVCNS